VRNGEETIADEAKLVGEEIVGVTAREDDVLDGGVGGDVGQGFFPSGFDGFIRCLCDGFGVPADCIGACAEAAVETTDRGCWMSTSMTRRLGIYE
jgi:hypothetical protein